MPRYLMIVALLVMGVALATPASRAVADSAPAGAKVYFVNIKDGDTVQSPFVVQFGLDGMKIAKAGINLPGTGHHHLLIDRELTEEDHGYAIPADDHHRHFGGGQTQVELNLEPGTYTLLLVMGNGDHVPFDPILQSDKITITVE